MDDTANLIEHVRYSSSGIPIGFVGGDADSDGDFNVSDTVDSDQFDTWILASQYDARADMDRDGTVDETDKTIALNNAGNSLGRGVLSGDPNTATAYCLKIQPTCKSLYIGGLG